MTCFRWCQWDACRKRSNRSALPIRLLLFAMVLEGCDQSGKTPPPVPSPGNQRNSSGDPPTNPTPGTALSTVVIEPDPPEYQAIRDRMPELSMTIDELFEAFAANAEKASVEYVGKFVEITGIVTWVLPVSTGNRSVISLGVDQDSSIRLLSASVIDREPWSIMSKGSTTTVKGTLGPDGISLTDAVIVATSGDSALQITATDLMKEFVADRKKASDKFFLRQFRMSGTIEMANEGEVWLKVDGLPKASVICSFVLQFDASHPIHSKFKPNDVIHVLAMNPYWYEFVPPPYESLVKVLMALPYTPRE